MGGEKYIKIFACKMEHILISSLGKLNTIKEYLRSYRIFGLKQFSCSFKLFFYGGYMLELYKNFD